MPRAACIRVCRARTAVPDSRREAGSQDAGRAESGGAASPGHSPRRPGTLAPFVPTTWSAPRARRPAVRACSLAARAASPTSARPARGDAAPSSRPLPTRRPSRCVCVIAPRHHGARVKMAAAVLSGPSAGSAAGVPGGTGGLSAVGSGPRLRLLLLESVSGLLQPRAGSAVAPVHPPVRSAAHLPGLMCLLRLHGTVGGAQVSVACGPGGERAQLPGAGVAGPRRRAGEVAGRGPGAESGARVALGHIHALGKPSVETQARGRASFFSTARLLVVRAGSNKSGFDLRPRRIWFWGLFRRRE